MHQCVRDRRFSAAAEAVEGGAADPRQQPAPCSLPDERRPHRGSSHRLSLARAGSSAGLHGFGSARPSYCGLRSSRQHRGRELASVATGCRLIQLGLARRRPAASPHRAWTLHQRKMDLTCAAHRRVGRFRARHPPIERPAGVRMSRRSLRECTWLAPCAQSCRPWKGPRPGNHDPVGAQILGSGGEQACIAHEPGRKTTGSFAIGLKLLEGPA